MHNKDHGFLRTASNSAVEFLLEKIFWRHDLVWAAWDDVWLATSSEVTDFSFGMYWGKNSSLVLENVFGLSAKSVCLVCVGVFCLFFRMEFLRMELRSSVVHLFKNCFRLCVLQAAAGFSQSFVWQRHPWPLLRDAAVGASKEWQGARSRLSSHGSRCWAYLSASDLCAIFRISQKFFHCTFMI